MEWAAGQNTARIGLICLNSKNVSKTGYVYLAVDFALFYPIVFCYVAFYAIFLLFAWGSPDLSWFHVLVRILEEVLIYRTVGCSKVKSYWKPNWDFPSKQGQKEDVKCIYQGGFSISEPCSPPCFNRKSQRNWVSNKRFSLRAA